MNRFHLFAGLCVAMFWVGCSSPTEPVPTRILSAPTTVSAPEVRVGTCYDTTITLVNRGTDSLHITAASSDLAAVSVSGIPATLAAGATATLKLEFCPNTIQLTTAHIALTTDGTDSTHYTINFIASGAPYTPRTGSVYTYDAIAIDSVGHFVPGSKHQVTEYVEATGLVYRGRTNVTHVTGGGNDTYYQVGPDGDVYIYAKGFPTGDTTNSLGAGWLQLPVKSHATVNIFAGDTSIVTPKVVVAVHGEISSTYLGDTAFTVMGKSLVASHVEILEQATYTPQGGAPIPYAAVFELFYSEALGYMTVQAAFVRSEILPRSGGELRLLTGYVLQ